MTVVSFHGPPTICNPIGRAAFEHPHGTEMTGSPNQTNCDVLMSPAADHRRRALHRRHHEDVDRRERFPISRRATFIA